MQYKTNYYFKCTVCGNPVKVVRNAKGRYQGFCKDCHTAIFLNTNTAFQLGILKKNIFTVDEYRQEAINER